MTTRTKVKLESILALREEGLGNAEIAKKLGLRTGDAVAAFLYGVRKRSGLEIPHGTHRPMGAANRHFNGGLHVRSNDGRTVIHCRDHSLVYFYRAVMEAHLGRHLAPSEVVHHVNGDPTDDRIENLELTTRADHARLHHKGVSRAKRA